MSSANGDGAGPRTSAGDPQADWTKLRSLWSRVIGLVVGFPIAYVVIAIFDAFSGIGGLPFGWVWATLPFVGVGVSLVWALMGTFRWRYALAGVAVVAGAGMGTWVWLGTPAGPTVLRHELNELSIPTDLTLIEESEYGNSLCLDSCSSVVRWYRRTGSLEDARSHLIAAFEAADFDLNSPYDDLDFIAVGGGIKPVEVDVGFENSTEGAPGATNPDDLIFVSLRATSK